MDTQALYTQRRSVGSFDSSKKLDNSLLKQIIDTAVLAPSAFNLQPWRLIVVKSAEAKQQLFDLSNKQPKVLEAPVVLILVGNKEGYAESNPVWEEMLQSVGGNTEIVDGAKGAAAYLYGTTEERKLKFAESNTGLLAMSLMIVAKDLGVDTHPMTGIDFDGIHKAFGLAEAETVVMTIAVGYANTEKPLYPRRPRRGFDEIASVV